MTDFDAIFSEDIEAVEKWSCELIGLFYANLAKVPLLAEALAYLPAKRDRRVDSIAERVKYHFYPYLFLGAFRRRVREEDARRIAVAGQLCAEAIILLDKLMDMQIEPPSTRYHAALLSLSFRQRHIVNLFAPLFKPKSEFWSYLEEFSNEHASAVLTEKVKFDAALHPYGLEEMETIAKGKQALAKIIPTALGLLARSEEKITPLCLSQDDYAIGLQLYDDLIDWKTDYENDRYSYVLCRVLLEQGFVKEGRTEEMPALSTVGKAIHYSDLGASILSDAEAYFESAVGRVEGLGCDDWVDYVRKTQADCRRLRSDLDKIREWLAVKNDVLRSSGRHMGDVQGATARPEPSDAIVRAINFLLDQRKENYPEARHLELVFDPEGGDSFCQWGDVFQRAIITDALLDARDYGMGVDETVIAEEIERIVASKLSRTRGGWSYFPGIKSLPPDSDDLGQILQVLVKSGYRQTAEVCEDPVSLLVKANSRPDGALDTWIADPDDPDSARLKQDMEAVWGTDADPEVMANSVYGLCLYDPERYSEAIRKGSNYLLARQEADGCWSSSWYWGKYYGTWACTRVLTTAGNHSDCLVKAGRFVLDTQNEEGGWGEPESTALDTAFAMMTLCNLPSIEKSSRNRPLNRALSFLLNKQLEAGNWEASEFIKIDVFRMLINPRDLGQTKPGMFKSSTISTAYCLKALIETMSTLERHGQ